MPSNETSSIIGFSSTVIMIKSSIVFSSIVLKKLVS